MGRIPVSDLSWSSGLPLSWRAYEFVAHELLVLILSGRFRAGDRLPSERELASHFGVSRPTIRHALGTLASHGLVETRIGSGTFVVPPPDDAAGATVLHEAESPKEVMEARLVVEVAAARLAARRSGSAGEDLELMRAIVEAIERVVDRGLFPTEVDLAFHRAVVKLTANSFLVELMAPLWKPTAAMLASSSSDGRWTPDDIARVAAEHRAVFEALRVGDQELAGFAMERHLRSELARLVDETVSEGPPPRFFA